MSKMISDLVEDQKDSRKNGDVQMIEAGEGKKKKVVKKAMAKKMK